MEAKQYVLRIPHADSLCDNTSMAREDLYLQHIDNCLYEKIIQSKSAGVFLFSHNYLSHDEDIAKNAYQRLCDGLKSLGYEIPLTWISNRIFYILLEWKCAISSSKIRAYIRILLEYKDNLLSMQNPYFENFCIERIYNLLQDEEQEVGISMLSSLDTLYLSKELSVMNPSLKFRTEQGVFYMRCK